MKIREAKKSDAAALLNLFSTLDRETDCMLFEPDERQMSVSQQEEILESFEREKRSIFLVAEHEEVQGFCVVDPGKLERNRHAATLVIGVQKACWSKGIGSGLMSRALAKAEEVGIKRVELTVRSDNQPAIRLYQKFGFVIEGERKASLCIGGELKDEYYMARV